VSHHLRLIRVHHRSGAARQPRTARDPLLVPSDRLQAQLRSGLGLNHKASDRPVLGRKAAVFGQAAFRFFPTLVTLAPLHRPSRVGAQRDVCRFALTVASQRTYFSSGGGDMKHTTQMAWLQRQDMLPGTSLVLGVVAIAALGACTPPATQFIASQRMRDAEPLAMKDERVAAVVMMQDDEVRRRAETALASEITKHGAKGVPMYTLFASSAIADEGAAKAALEQAQVKGAVVMRPYRAQHTVVTPASTYTAPLYNAYWGAYYPYGWGGAYGGSMTDPVNPYRTTYGAQQSYTVDVKTPEHVERYDVVRVEVLVYSFKQNRLVWVGEAESTDPGKVESFVEELTELTADELDRVYLLNR